MERLKEDAGRSLPVRVTRSDATTPEDIVTRTALQQRYVEPTKMILGQYKTGLARQERGAPTFLNGAPILLEPNKLETEEDNELIWWVPNTESESYDGTTR